MSENDAGSPGREGFRAGSPLVLVVLAHPDQQSLNGAVAAAVVAGVKRAGGEPLLQDLYRDGFDPRLTAGELAQPPMALVPPIPGSAMGSSALGTPTAPSLAGEATTANGVHFADEMTARYARELLRADAVVIVHPVWFFHVPAILKGWVDRVVREGVAFQVDPAGKVRALLRASSALVITTANTSPATEAAAFGAPLDTFWRSIVFGPVGVDKVERLALAPVRDSEPSTRAAWLSEVGLAAARLVSNLDRRS